MGFWHHVAIDGIGLREASAWGWPGYVYGMLMALFALSSDRLTL